MIKVTIIGLLIFICYIEIVIIEDEQWGQLVFIDEDELNDLKFYAYAGKKLTTALSDIGKERNYIIDTGNNINYAYFTLNELVRTIKPYEGNPIRKWMCQK